MSPRLREMVRETTLLPQQLIAPLFIKEGITEKIAISSMPGIYQLSQNDLEGYSVGLLEKKIKSVLLFGIPLKKDGRGSEAFNPNGVIQNAIKIIKDKCPDLFVITDVCLCEYTDHGHCGVVDNQKLVDNDETLELLAQIAVSHAKAGADMVAPSGMMDGQTATMRSALDTSGFSHIPVMSYAVKYASCFYSPFRSAAQSAPQFGERKNYQMDFANAREAFKEAKINEEEGADILMIKPALPSLDIIRGVKNNTNLPVAAYQVSGEYSMICSASEKGWINRREAIIESLTVIKRAGADLIVTYFAGEFADAL